MRESTSKKPRSGLPCLFFILSAVAAGVLPGCGAPDPAEDAVARAIQVHGGDRFEEMDVSFAFREFRFRVVQEGGRFLYQRTRVGPGGEEVVESLSNDGAERWVDGRPIPLDEAGQHQVATGVNSVVYFGFLPFRLQDPAVILRDLGEVSVHDRPYRKVEVTFRQEGGGEDWEDRFVYWFHRDEGTLDYLAYRYHRDGGGTRFRRAVNRREVGGLLIQDYENYAGLHEVDDIGDYGRLLEEGLLRLVSMVELEDVVVNGIPELAWDEGLEVRLGIERAEYQPGEAMEVVLAVRNSTVRPRRLHLSAPGGWEFVISRSDGTTVGRWSGEPDRPRERDALALEPGAEESWLETVPAPERPGSYVLRGAVTTREGELATRLPFQVRP